MSEVEEGEEGAQVIEEEPEDPNYIPIVMKKEVIASSLKTMDLIAGKFDNSLLQSSNQYDSILMPIILLQMVHHMLLLKQIWRAKALRALESCYVTTFTVVRSTLKTTRFVI